MTRAAAVTGLLLALVLLVDALGSPAPWLRVATALLVIGAGVGPMRRQTIAHLALCALGLALLGWSLILYFRTLHPWPLLAIIGLAAGTLGLGLVGFLLDRYEAPPEKRPTL